MRYLLFLLTAIGMAAGTLAQNLSDKPGRLSGIDLNVSTGMVSSSETKTNVIEFLQGDSGLPSLELAPVTNMSALTGTEEILDNRVSFLMNVGVQYSDEGEYAEAEKAYQRALKKDPENQDILFRISTLYIMMKEYRKAVDSLTTMLDKFPDNPMIHNNLAWVYATGGEMKNGPLALYHAREALLSAPFAPSMWNTLAEAYYVTGDYDKALRSSKEATELLLLNNPSDEDKQSFAEQQAKIIRAKKALKLLQGTDDEDE